jgi:hypothetical protein
MNRQMVALEPDGPQIRPGGPEDGEPIIPVVAGVAAVALQAVEHLVEGHDGDSPGECRHWQENGEQAVRRLFLMAIKTADMKADPRLGPIGPCPPLVIVEGTEQRRSQIGIEELY